MNYDVIKRSINNLKCSPDMRLLGHVDEASEHEGGALQPRPTARTGQKVHIGLDHAQLAQDLERVVAASGKEV